jgi:surface antigen
MIKLRPFVPVVCSVALLLTTSAQAQINPFRSGSRAGLRPNDIKLMEEAASKLLAKPDLRVGSTEAWSNDSTGASGTVSVEDTNQHRGLTCHKVNYATSQRTRPTRDTVVNWCKTPSGWKIG